MKLGMKNIPIEDSSFLCFLMSCNQYYEYDSRANFCGGDDATEWRRILIFLDGIPSLPNTLSWRGAQLKHRDSFTFYTSSINMQLLLR
jgi:hypothetical protein